MKMEIKENEIKMEFPIVIEQEENTIIKGNFNVIGIRIMAIEKIEGKNYYVR